MNYSAVSEVINLKTPKHKRWKLTHHHFIRNATNVVTLGTQYWGGGSLCSPYSLNLSCPGIHKMLKTLLWCSGPCLHDCDWIRIW